MLISVFLIFLIFLSYLVIIPLIDLTLSQVLSKIRRSVPFQRHISIIFTNIIRLFFIGFIFFFLGYPIDSIFYLLLFFIILIFSGLLLTGVVGDIIRGVTLIQQSKLFPGQRLIVRLPTNNSRTIIIKDFGLLNIQGYTEENSIETISYLFLCRNGFEVISI